MLGENFDRQTQKRQPRIAYSTTGFPVVSNR